MDVNEDRRTGKAIVDDDDKGALKLDLDPAEELIDYELASGAALVRELPWRVLFVRSEPEYFPPDGPDEDTGEIAPVLNYRPANEARMLARQLTHHPGARHILAEWNWTNETQHADWETMLKHLPPCRLEGDLRRQ